jgi:hypothetical protein
MSRYQFELAGPQDDADLRQVLANTPMPGDIALTFCREPGFFAAPGVDGFQCQVVACRDTSSGRIVGFGCRSLRRLYVNGTPRTIGYLSGIRLLVEHRNQGLVARGYRFFRELHRDGQAPLYLTTISEGNEAALKILASGRAGLPIYHEAGRFRTLALPVHARSNLEAPKNLYLRTATPEDWPMIMSFLDKHGPRRQFFPCYEVADVATPAGALFGLQAKLVVLAYRNRALAGLLAGWDQHDFRQTIVHGYAGALRWLRPLYNGWASLTGRPRLPRPGRELRYLTAALPVVVGDDASVFRALLDSLLQMARSGPWQHVAIGLAANDPLATGLSSFAGTEYVTRIFQVAWPDGNALRLGLDGRPPYLELGCL